MRKILYFLFLLILIGIMYGCSRTGYYSPNLETPTLMQKDIDTRNSDAESTLTPTTVATSVEPTTTILTLTPIPTLDPYAFIGVTGNIDLAFGPVVIEFTDGALKGKKITTNLISPEELGDYNSTSEGLKVGNGVGVIRPDDYGNLLIGIHSGYHLNVPLDGEFLRFFFEGWGGNSDTYVSKNLTKIVGTNGVLLANDTSLNVEVAGAVRLQHQEAEELGLNPTTVLNIVTRKDDSGYIALGNPEVFENAKISNHEILLNFCGWGSHFAEFSYYRYVVLLRIKEK